MEHIRRQRKMFNKFKLKEALKSYKKDFTRQHWSDEKYKWEAVKCFQDNWDVNADDFAGMLTKALAQTANLLASSNNFPAKMITDFAKDAKEDVRAMFIELFDESKDAYERIASFKSKSGSLLERYGNGSENHYQKETAITTYLWLRYPDKYYIYKLSEISEVSAKLESGYQFKKGDYANNFRNFIAFYDEICEELQHDDELRSILNSQLTDTCYPDPRLRTLTIDFGFYISRCYDVKEKTQTDESYRMDYSPELSANDWSELIRDPEVFTQGALQTVKCYLDYGKEVTCTQLSMKEFYGVTTQVQEEVLFQIGYRTDITTANVIAFRGVNYEITRIGTFVGYKSDLVLYCKTE